MKTNNRVIQGLWAFQQFIKPEWKKMILPVLFQVLNEVVRTGDALLLGVFLNALVAGDRITMALILTVYVAYSRFGLTIETQRNKLNVRRVQEICRNVSHRIISHIAYVSPAVMDQLQLGVIHDRAGNTPWRVAGTLDDINSLLLRNGFAAVMAAIAIGAVMWEGLVIIILAAILFAFATYRLVASLVDIRKKVHDTEEKMSQAFASMIHTNSTIIRADSMQFVLEKYKQLYEEYLAAVIADEFAFFERWGVMRDKILNYLGIAVLGLLATKALAQQIDVGQAYIVIDRNNTFCQALWELAHVMDYMFRSTERFKRGWSLLRLEKRWFAAKQVIPQFSIPMAISISDLSVFGEAVDIDTEHIYTTTGTPLIRRITLEIMAGETLALVGASGAGKSTLVKAICGELARMTGTVKINGVKMGLDTGPYLAQHTVTISQSIELAGNTPFDIISMYDPAITEEIVMESIRRVGLSDRILGMKDGIYGKVGNEGEILSGGEKQRLAIAHVIARITAHPGKIQFVVIDEATSALDSLSEMIIQEQLGEIMRGRTAIVIAHRFSTLRHVDRIAVINNGHISEIGSHAELYALGGQYKAMYDAQKLE